MSKLTRLDPKTATSAVATVSQSPTAPDTQTYNAGPGWTRTEQSDLFLLGVTAMFGEDTFYEQAAKRNSRFVALVQANVRADAAWVARFVPYLRNTMNIRTAAVVMAVEYARTLLAMQKDGTATGDEPTGRGVVSDALQRADEPAEALAYAQHVWGRSVPWPVKRGIADAVRRLYTQRSALKYDGASGTIRMGDVVEVVHPKPQSEQQHALFRYLIDARHKREAPPRTEGLLMVTERKRLDAMPVPERQAWFEEATTADIAGVLARAGATWEWLGGWLQGPMTAKAWEAVIPEMGYMALIRNLRNFDEAGVSAFVKEQVAKRLADPAEVARSRQLPMRFYSAWKEAKGMHWGVALESALQSSLLNVPVLAGPSLVLVDLSTSMDSPVGGARSKALRLEVATLFGAALALRSEDVTLVGFSNDSKVVHYSRADALLRLSDEVKRSVIHGGTQTWQAVLAHLKPEHRRLIILTDEQADAGYGGHVADVVGKRPLYTFNLAGYSRGHAPSGGEGRYTFGGLNDRAFTAIEALEARQNVGWPF